MRCISSVVPKSDIIVNDFTVKNEPLYGYMPGSPERVELEAALVKYSDVTEDVPIVIGGQEYRTDDVRYQVMVKFIYSEKATKFCKISTVDLSHAVPVKFTVDILKNFIDYYRAFSTSD